MKILIVGNGGREHALAWKFSQSDRVSNVYVAKGNSGCELVDKVECLNISGVDELLKFALNEEIDLTLVGSEELLVAGIVDKFEQNGLNIFGPNKKAAQLEGSKAFAKDFMLKYGIKTAKHQSFTEYAAALKYLDHINYPLVIKASGLAAGKGVVIAQNRDEAEITLAGMLVEQVFGEAGCEVVIEEFLVGVEASILSFTDSKVILPLISAKDHKKSGEGDTGLNTGGMGAIAPNPFFTLVVNDEFIHKIMEPTLHGMQAEGMEFAGVIFFGLMITNHGVYLLEYNMRMGDPETQAIVPLLKNDLSEVIEAALQRRLSEVTLEWEDGATCCVVLASGGYPGKYITHLPIQGLREFKVPHCQLFAAGVTNHGHECVTNGGRVLNIVAKGCNLDEAIARAYTAIDAVNFDKMYYRRDIGKIKI